MIPTLHSICSRITGIHRFQYRRLWRFVPFDALLVAAPIYCRNCRQALHNIKWNNHHAYPVRHRVLAYTHLQFHIAFAKMFGLHAELKSQCGLLQSLVSHYDRLELLQNRLLGRLAVDEPVQVRCRFGEASGAVHLHHIADLVAWTAVRDSRSLFRQCCVCVSMWTKLRMTFHIFSGVDLLTSYRQQSCHHDRKPFGTKVPRRILRNDNGRLLINWHFPIRPSNQWSCEAATPITTCL